MKSSIGSNQKVAGNNQKIVGSNAEVNGNNNEIIGSNALVRGNNNKITGNNAIVHGNNNHGSGSNATIRGNNNKWTGSNCDAIGQNNDVVDSTYGRRNTAAPDEDRLYQVQEQVALVPWYRYAADKIIGGGDLVGNYPNAARLDTNIPSTYYTIPAHYQTTVPTITVDARGRITAASGQNLSGSSRASEKVQKYVEGPLVDELKHDVTAADDAKPEDTCLFCMSQVSCCIVLPCRHLCLCIACTRRMVFGENGDEIKERGMVKCPQCRADAKKILRAHK